MHIYYLKTPLQDEDIRQLRLGDIVYLSGDIFTGRSLLQRYILEEGHTLPFSTEKRNVLIHVGPIVVKEDSQWRLVSFMPTSSIRFEKWGAQSIVHWGLKMIVGKTTMGNLTARMMKKKGCVHVTTQCVSPNLCIDSISIQNVYLFDELGSIEATWHMHLDNLGPFVVDIDCEGENLFDRLDENIAARKQEVYEMLSIPKDFKYTKLY